MNTQLYLITGFLGAGKTTLMKRLIDLFSDKKLAVIINEFGIVSIDGEILDVSGIKITEINNGSIFCVCRSNKFTEALSAALRMKAEVVLVETSGLSDPSGMGEILENAERAFTEQYDFRGTIVLVDASSFLKVINAVAAVKQQIANGSLILINKTDKSGPEQIALVKNEIESLNPQASIKETSFAEFERKWLYGINTARPQGNIGRRTIGIQKLCVYVPDKTKEDLLIKWLEIFSSVIYRAKGFVNLNTGIKLLEVINNEVSVTDWKRESKNEGALVILASNIKNLEGKITTQWKKVFGTEIMFIDP